MVAHETIYKLNPQHGKLFHDIIIIIIILHFRSLLAQ